MVTKFEKEMEFIWTDGGNPAGDSYFDGAGDLNYILQRMFAGRDGRYDETPIHVDVMGSVEYGSKVKLKIILEIEDKK